MNRLKSDGVINIIAKNPNSETIFTETLYNDGSLKTLADLETYELKRTKWAQAIFCGFDRSTQQSILVYNSQKNDGQINWKTDFDKIPIATALCATAPRPITIIAACYEEAPGFGELSDDILNVAEFLKILLFVLTALHHYIFPFRFLAKKYQLPEDYIRETICQSNTWSIGFISTESFKYKRLVERSVMKKLGYRKSGDKWALKSEAPSKLPYEIMRGDK